jgi:hypothetical protein
MVFVPCRFISCVTKIPNSVHAIRPVDGFKTSSWPSRGRCAYTSLEGLWDMGTPRSPPTRLLVVPDKWVRHVKGSQFTDRPRQVGPKSGVGAAGGGLKRRGRRPDRGARHGGGHGATAAAWRRSRGWRGARRELELHLLEAVGAWPLLQGSAGRRLGQHVRHGRRWRDGTGRRRTACGAWTTENLEGIRTWAWGTGWGGASLQCGTPWHGRGAGPTAHDSTHARDTPDAGPARGRSAPGPSLILFRCRAVWPVETRNFWTEVWNLQKQKL